MTRIFDPTDKELDRLPTWLQLISQVVFKFGVPSAIAIYLVWIGADNLPAIRMELVAQHQEIGLIKQTLSDIRKQTEQNFTLLQWICATTAKTEIEKRGCFQR
jgi:hypothetical protein